MNPLLFTPLRLGPLTLPNRVVGLPLYLAYPGLDNEVNDLVLDYYAEIADSGAGLVVVENATVEPRGLGNPRTLLASLCTKRIVAQRPAYCGCWPQERRERFLERVGG